MLGKYFRVAAGGVTDPATISGVKAWWKASSIAQSDSTAVSSWTDSISSIAVTQATGANQPTYRTTQGPNSTPAVSFDGSNDFLKNTSVLGSALFSNNQCHIFIVQKQDSTNANNTSIGWGPGAGECFNTHLTFGDTCYFDYGNKNTGTTNGRISVAQPSGWDNSWRLVQLIRTSGNVQSIRDQGSELTNATRSKTLDVTLTQALRIGIDDGETVALKGFITDILICNVALDSTDRGLIETYFNSIYSLF